MGRGNRTGAMRELGVQRHRAAALNSPRRIFIQPTLQDAWRPARDPGPDPDRAPDPGRVIQDQVYELRRTPFPGTSVNKGPWGPPPGLRELGYTALNSTGCNPIDGPLDV